MNKIYVAGLFIILEILSQPLKSFAQTDMNKLIRGNLLDANKITEGYIGPVMRGLGEGLNQGWYNTAKTHKTFGVDFTITTSLMFIPGSDKFYTIDNKQLDLVQLVEFDGQSVSPTGSGDVPTIFGPDKVPTYQLLGAEFNGLAGLGLKENIKIADALPIPMYQLGIGGLPKSTDLKIRFFPTIKIGDIKYSFFGIGIMHDVKQWIPGIKNLPFDMSGFIGFTTMKLDVDISGTSVSTNQRGILEFNSTTIQGLISKKISVLTFYGGLGCNLSKSNLDIKGTYDMDNNGTPEVTDPVAQSFKNNGLRATAGMRLKLSIFTLHVDYTLAKFNSLSAGFGISTGLR